MTDYEKYLGGLRKKYGAECGDLLGKEIFGVFTDEPHRGAIFSGFGISNENKDKMTPYTSVFPPRRATRSGEES